MPQNIPSFGGHGRRHRRTQNLPTKVLWVRPPPRVPVEGRRDQLQSEAVSWIEGQAGETQIAGRSRQAIDNKKTRPAVYEAFHAAKAALKAGAPTPTADLRRTLAEQIKSLRDTIEAKDRQLDAWAEKWAAVEFNAHKKRIDPDLLLQPLPSFTQ